MLRRISKGLLVFLLVFSWGSLCQSASTAPVSFSKGVLAFSDGDFKKALHFFQDAYKADPQNPDNIYLLAVTHLKLNHFSEASTYFKDLLDKNPSYTRAYFDYALSLNRQNKYSEGLSWFEKARSADSKNPLPLFYIGVSNYYLGKKDLALQTFKKVDVLFPESEVAEGVKEWITRIESKEMPAVNSQGGAKEKLKKWSLRASTSFFYDTNLTLDPDSENLTGVSAGNQEDIMATAALDLRYLLYHTENARLFVNYSGYQSAYGGLDFDSDSFNYGRHKVGVDYQYRISDDLQWRAPISFSYFTLGTNKYLMSGEGESAFDVAWNGSWLTTFSAKIRRDDFFTTPSNSVQTRDALKAALGVEQYFFFPGNRNRYLKGSYDFSENFASGKDWDYKMHHATFAFNTPLIWKINLLLLNDYGILRKFNNSDSVFSVKRGDFTFTGMGVLSREMAPHFTVSASYTYSFSDSNIPRFTYSRQISGVTLTTTF